MTVNKYISDLTVLRNTAANCTACALHEGRNLPVFDKGNQKAKILICGMVPAKDENAAGIPFVGRAGKLLDVLLTKAGLTYDDVYITNLVKCFLAAGKKLEQDWIDACFPYIITQILMIKPKIIILLGKDAATTILNLDSKKPLGSIQGKLYEYATDIKAIPTYHPSYLLRTGGENSPKFENVLEHFIYAKELVSN